MEHGPFLVGFMLIYDRDIVPKKDPIFGTLWYFNSLLWYRWPNGPIDFPFESGDFRHVPMIRMPWAARSQSLGDFLGIANPGSAPVTPALWESSGLVTVIVDDIYHLVMTN